MTTDTSSFVWVCLRLCTVAVHSTAQNTSDKCPPYSPDKSQPPTGSPVALRSYGNYYL